MADAPQTQMEPSAAAAAAAIPRFADPLWRVYWQQDGWPILIVEGSYALSSQTKKIRMDLERKLAAAPTTLVLGQLVGFVDTFAVVEHASLAPIQLVDAADRCRALAVSVAKLKQGTETLERVLKYAFSFAAAIPGGGDRDARRAAVNAVAAADQAPAWSVVPVPLAELTALHDSTVLSSSLLGSLMVKTGDVVDVGGKALRARRKPEVAAPASPEAPGGEGEEGAAAAKTGKKRARPSTGAASAAPDDEGHPEGDSAADTTATAAPP